MTEMILGLIKELLPIQDMYFIYVSFFVYYLKTLKDR